MSDTMQAAKLKSAKRFLKMWTTRAKDALATHERIQAPTSEFVLDFAMMMVDKYTQQVATYTPANAPRKRPAAE